jgi:hypothetical protein
MGTDFSGKGGYFSVNNATWREVLVLAHEHGWEPAGTEMPKSILYNEDGSIRAGHTRACWEAAKNWESMDYFSNVSQWVTDEDASIVADALERALEAEPGDEELGSRSTDYVREFITFCRAGTFCIF